MAGETLLGIMREVARGEAAKSGGAELILARVVSADPPVLRLKSGVVVSDEFIALSPFCREKLAKDGTVIFEGLKSGGLARVLKSGDGSLYYVLEPA